ncbi:hypothetical protein AVEN_127890-1 [Araneus ventricosus]|uniref:Uncharacterized protein n=1 Tax=Araneus ventricosus TaxID=182803 RepID=A0A4Y1ZZL6_ARAVE|nr:hypothetical protein AVEN_127890-1 [Araneus ventricosus]
MPLKFLTAKEALKCLRSLDDNDLDNIDNEFVILPQDSDALSDTEDIDDSSTKKIEEIRNPSCRKLGVQQANEDFLKLKNEDVIVKKPVKEDTSATKPKTICKKYNVGLCLKCFLPFRLSKDR